MSLECQINERAAQPVLSVRTRTSLANIQQTLGYAYGAVAQYLGEMGEQPTGAPFTAYYNMEMQDLDVEAGFPVAHSLPGRGDIQASEIPAGPQGSVVYVGPYEGIKEAYDALTQYAQEHGYAPSGPAYEIYLTDPMQTPPEQLMTEVMFPLVKVVAPVPA
jgi:effector-binding domain-containing protein